MIKTIIFGMVIGIIGALLIREGHRRGWITEGGADGGGDPGDAGCGGDGGGD